jgi:UDP-N-acetylglucosamine 2-epimerase (non-hydrolysing)
VKKILIVFGTRPEAIKMAPLVKAFEDEKESFDVKVCVSGQHRDMVDNVLTFFDIVPDYDLNIMKEGQDLYDVTSAVLLGMRGVLNEFQPDLVCVHGDTTTTFATSLACYYQKIAVAHVEAGLRTFNKYSPFPEEIYRELICKITHYHFPPTQKAKENLFRDNISEENICVTGNTVIDSLHLTLDKTKEDPTIKTKLNSFFKDDFAVDSSKFILVTAHRRENFGEGLKNIILALKELAIKYPNIEIVYPVHLNPNVKEPVNRLLSGISNIHLIAPLEYELFIYLMSKAYLILTDSGGVQEEAPSLGKPVLVMRDTTERQEAIEAGTVKLVGTEQDAIVSNVKNLLENDNEYRKMSLAYNPYGDGKACQRIIEYLKKVK